MSLEKAFDMAIQKTSNNIIKIGSDLREFPAQHDGNYFKCPKEKHIKLAHIFNWTQSFFLGMAFLAYRATSDEKYLNWLNSFCDDYHKKVFDTPLDTMHDLGFLYSPYVVALYKLNGDKNMKKIAVKAADALTQRFVPNGSYIRAWGRMDDKIPDYVDAELAKNHFFTESKGLAIIDCMMNLPLLFWASDVTGHPFYKNIAIAHADMTMKYFVREDNSVCHAYRFDEETGEPIGVESYCGFNKDSHWARGTSWAIYGFAIAYSYTKNDKYLDVAYRLAKRFIQLCEEDGVPVWDFKLPEEKPALYTGDKKEWLDWDVSNPKNKIYNTDTSAAAIAVCGIYELIKHKQDKTLTEYANKTLHTLAEKYTDYNSDISGLLKCQNGNMTYACFGDYFLMEALSTKLYGYDGIW